MQEKSKRSVKFWRSRPWRIAAITTLLTGLFAATSLAENLGQWTNSILTQLKSNKAILDQFTKVSQEFNNDMKNITGITDLAIAAITGKAGQLVPDKTKKEIEKKASSNPIGVALSQGSGAVATGAKASDSVLSESAQEADLKKATDMIAATKESGLLADDIGAVNKDVQRSQSSQDVLKGLAEQNVYRSQIDAAQVQLLLSIATDLQKNKQQSAALNQSLSELLKYQQGERQKQSLAENEHAKSAAIKDFRNMTQGF
jgi:hypothetical protein